MKCPICTGTQLIMTSREGVEIDYCPNCRGVWLDRGELDKIVEASVRAQSPVFAQDSVQTRYDNARGDRQQHGGHRSHHSGGDHRGLLKRLFD